MMGCRTPPAVSIVDSFNTQLHPEKAISRSEESPSDDRQCHRILSARAAQAERDLSPHTLAAYASDLRQFAEWSARSGVSEVGAIDRKLLRRYVAFLSERRLARRSIHRKAERGSGVAPLGRSTGNHRRRSFRRTERAEAGARPLPQSSEGPADASVLCELPPLDDPLGVRDRAVLELLYGSGLRVAELCGLDLEDFDLASGTVHVLGKGRKQRQLPISRPGRRILETYLRDARSNLLTRSKQEATETAVFINTRGRRLGPRQTSGPCWRSTSGPRG